MRHSTHRTGRSTLSMKHPIRTTAIVATVVIVVAVLAAAVAAGLWARGVAEAANMGKAQVLAGAKLLGSQDATGAALQFNAASLSFARTRTMLDRDGVGRVVGAIPSAANQFSAARTLLAIGLDGSAAGSEVAAALREASAPSQAASSTARLTSLFTTGRPHVDAALTSLTRAADLAAKLDGRGLLPQIARPVGTVKAAFAEAAPLLRRSRALLALGSYLFSSKHRVLVVAQDNAELKPTGGFMGSFGIVDVGPNGVKLARYADVYTLPDPPVRVKPPPGARMAQDQGFTFRDSNWWIDFPTSARTMLGFWEVAHQPKVDGIVAVDVIAMKDLLQVLGPIRVPGYVGTFTSANLLERLLQLVERPARRNRKGPLVALAFEMENRLFGASSAELGGAALALGKAADAKHVQMYFREPSAEAAVIGLGWSGRVASPPGTTDLLVVSNAMAQGSKVNMAMKKSIDYEVALRPKGSADTTLVLGYVNANPYEIGGNGRRGTLRFFRDYLRVNRPAGTVFPHTATGPVGGGEITTEYGLPTAVRTFKLWRMRSHDETITSRVPVGAWRPGGAPRPRGRVVVSSSATSSAPGSLAHYRLFIVRQADLEDIPTNVSVRSPAGWHVSSVSARLIASGQVLPVTRDRAGARLSLPLSGDLLLDVVLMPDSAGAASR